MSVEFSMNSMSQYSYSCGKIGILSHNSARERAQMGSEPLLREHLEERFHVDVAAGEDDADALAGTGDPIGRAGGQPPRRSRVR